jgi:hypothetical protein
VKSVIDYEWIVNRESYTISLDYGMEYAMVSIMTSKSKDRDSKRDAKIDPHPTPTPRRRGRGKNMKVHPDHKAEYHSGYVLAANPLNQVIAPVPTAGDSPILVRTTKIRLAFQQFNRGVDGDRVWQGFELSMPPDIMRALGLEVGMNMVLQAYADGRVMMTRAGAYVRPEEREI